ncbi:nuclear transport factor 2 family protein [Paraburkholderia sp. CNPSo 3274]|uniref:nuclear transport factor 2 family protein n=1 Tax=Paraburkholderia sp. CNPSo 3274 TaxID=2940932 RepID=UPI0020B6E32D|nr:nuclear transport factor 2 family protein [Paraburkholderia sp. CNPSo 3274]MCP3712162.1 nuclear transport factor 2 family protein [Paraburkholderia sp. CNPSo 3274]
MLTPTEVLSSILEKPTDIDHVRALVTPDVTYVSLNYDNPDLKRIMPWAGTSHGPESIVKTFVDVGSFWEIQSFEPEALFGTDEYAAMFGRFTYRSTVLSKVVTTPFAVFAKVEHGRCTYLQFMEDTFATGASFRSGGSWTFQGNPNGERVVL